MKKLALFSLIILPMLAASCTSSVTQSSFLMDTVVTYDIAAKDAEQLIGHCDDLTSALESTLSAHIEESAVSRFNRGEELTDPDALMIAATAIDVYYNTMGAYDITVAPLVTLWDVAHADDGWTPPSDGEINEALGYVGAYKLVLDYDRLITPYDGTKIDLGGLAKGYALGVTAEYLSENNAVGTVSFGGNVAVIGSKSDGSPWQIGVKDPEAPDTLIGVLSLDSGMVAVSGGYERYAEHEGVRYHHIIDPSTGNPSSSDLLSAAVVVDSPDRLSGALCDALSTALFVLGSDASMTLYESGVYDFEALLVKEDGTVILTDGLTDRFTAYEK